jgi:hypothetical protein
MSSDAPATPTIIDSFFNDLAEHPDEFGLRGIFADWCEDNPELAWANLAECMRWMIRHTKRPWRTVAGRGNWFNAAQVSPGIGDPSSDLPEFVYEYLEGGRVVLSRREYPTMREAEEAFYEAWKKALSKGQIVV